MYSASISFGKVALSSFSTSSVRHKSRLSSLFSSLSLPKLVRSSSTFQFQQPQVANSSAPHPAAEGIKTTLETMPEPTLDRKLFILPNDTPVCGLECRKAFEGLTEKQRNYAHYLGKASFVGSLIVFHQTSPESPLLHVIFQKLFRSQSVAELKKVALETAEFTEEEFQSLLVFIAGFSANSGNYKGFGDTKFVPEVDKSKVWVLIEGSSAYGSEGPVLKELWSLVGDRITSLTPHCQKLGLGAKGVTTYHSWNVSLEDNALIGRFMKEKGLEGWNSRLFKTLKDGQTHFEIRLASIEQGEVGAETEFEGCHIRVTRGDYSPILKKTLPLIEAAAKEAGNETEIKMLEKYAEHFKTGSLDAHKDGSRQWIKNPAPPVETYIGFIENYRDPVGVRSEFEGFVAAVNKEMSEKFTRLVSNAEDLLKRLPWGQDYEKDSFLKPDFTSLDVIGFGGSGIPAGINIPNYDEIRQSEGFKNVSLGNVISAMPSIKLNFLTEEDDKMFKTYFKDSFEVQVGLHELLGHGSGKLFIRNKDGSFNFDKKTVKNYETGNEVDSWYEEGETWGGKFGALASSYEECRAEAVGYFLCCFPDVLKIFGFEGEKAEDVKYTNWMAEIRAGLMGLEMYSLEDNKWGQAHSYARYVLLRVVMEGEGGLVEIETKTGEDGEPDLLFTLHRDKIDSVGKPAIFNFLKLLQLYKTTGNFEKGKELFERYGKVDELAQGWQKIVIARRQPRRLFVQPNTTLDDQGLAQLKDYPSTIEGVVESYIDRYRDVADLEDEMINLYKKDISHFQ